MPKPIVNSTIYERNNQGYISSLPPSKMGSKTTYDNLILKTKSFNPK